MFWDTVMGGIREIEKAAVMPDEREVIFIMGVEGSGTTMLQHMTDMSKAHVLLGGNVVSDGWNGVAARFNELCTRLWDREAGRERRARLVKEIRAVLVECPDDSVFKRSYPFIDEAHVPKVRDIIEFSGALRVIYLKRNCIDNVRSVLRRGFESDVDRASERIIGGYRDLLRDVTIIQNMGVSMLELNYDRLIEPATREREVGRLIRFLGMDDELKQNLVSYIRT